MAMRLSGIWFKYVEPDGFYLGILMMPQDAADMVEKHGRARTRKAWVPSAVPSFKVQGSVMVEFIDIVAMDQQVTGAVAVFGISPSDLNKERGFAFVPSADYLQRGYKAPPVEMPTGNRYKAPEVEFAP